MFEGYARSGVGIERAESGSAEAFFLGGYGVYTANDNYVMLTAAGNMGSSHQAYRYLDIFGNLLPQSQSYETVGVGGGGVIGHIFSLDGAPLGSAKDSPGDSGGLKLDLRAGVTCQYFTGDESLTAFGAVKPRLHEWVGSGSATLFTQYAIGNGVVWRPCVKGEARYELDYDNAVREDAAGVGITSYHYHENATIGIAEAGFDYVWSGATFNAAVYCEFAGDQSSVGGKLALKFKLD